MCVCAWPWYSSPLHRPFEPVVGKNQLPWDTGQCEIRDYHCLVSPGTHSSTSLIASLGPLHTLEVTLKSRDVLALVAGPKSFLLPQQYKSHNVHHAAPSSAPDEPGQGLPLALVWLLLQCLGGWSGHGTAAVWGCGGQDVFLEWVLSGWPDFCWRVVVHLRAWKAALGLRESLASRSSTAGQFLLTAAVTE